MIDRKVDPNDISGDIIKNKSYSLSDSQLEYAKVFDWANFKTHVDEILTHPSITDNTRKYLNFIAQEYDRMPAKTVFGFMGQALQTNIAGVRDAILCKDIKPAKSVGNDPKLYEQYLSGYARTLRDFGDELGSERIDGIENAFHNEFGATEDRRDLKEANFKDIVHYNTYLKGYSEGLSMVKDLYAHKVKMANNKKSAMAAIGGFDPSNMQPKIPELIRIIPKTTLDGLIKSYPDKVCLTYLKAKALQMLDTIVPDSDYHEDDSNYVEFVQDSIMQGMKYLKWKHGALAKKDKPVILGAIEYHKHAREIGASKININGVTTDNIFIKSGMPCEYKRLGDTI